MEWVEPVSRSTAGAEAELQEPRQRVEGRDRGAVVAASFAASLEERYWLDSENTERVQRDWLTVSELWKIRFLLLDVSRGDN